MTTGQPPSPYPMMMIGTLEIKVPNTGTNPNIKTNRAIVTIYGKPVPWPMIPMRVNQIVVSTVFTIAIIP